MVKGTFCLRSLRHTIRNFLFDLENDTIVCQSRLIATLRNDFSIRALPAVCHPHRHGQNRPILALSLQYSSSPSLLVRPIPDADSTTLPLYPVGTGSSAIRPNIAPNRRRVRCSTRYTCAPATNLPKQGAKGRIKGSSRRHPFGPPAWRGLG